jgi:hypothetical protein
VNEWPMARKKVEGTKFWYFSKMVALTKQQNEENYFKLKNQHTRPNFVPLFLLLNVIKKRTNFMKQTISSRHKTSSRNIGVLRNSNYPLTPCLVESPHDIGMNNALGA